MAKTAYLGNPLLKRINVNLPFTQDEVAEYIKCSEDPIYFIKEYIHIVNVDKGLMKFDLYPFQEELVKGLYDHRFTIVKCPRQSGKSQTSLAFMLHYVLFHDQKNVAILANKGATARELLGRLQMAYERLPKFLQQGVAEWNKGSIELENGSRILAGSTSSSAIRGYSFNLIFLDEFAFIQQNMAEDFFRSVYPTISSGTSSKVIIVSTPNGMNHFYKMWSDAKEERSNYWPYEISWWDVPGRDQEWKEMTIANTSEEQFRQEFECEFLGSGNTLISPMKLSAMPIKTPIYSKDNLDVYYEPQRDHHYMITADIAHGRGLDYSTASVFDVTTWPIIHVAKFRDNTISPLLFPAVLHKIGTDYNTADILIENNDNGMMTASVLHYDLEYENMINLADKADKRLGIRMTKSVKLRGCSNIKDLIENDKLIICDFDTIAELSTFITRGASYAAEDGAHDDLAMNLVLFAWLTSQDYFKDLTDTDLRLKLFSARELEIENDLTPFGFMDDGGVSEPEIINEGGELWQIDADWQS